MATIIEPVRVTISIRAKPLLYIAAIAHGIAAGRGGWLHRLGNRLIDHCTVIT